MENVNVNSGLTQKITEKDNNSSLTPKNNFGLEKEYKKNKDIASYHLEQADLWAKELSNKTAFSKGLTYGEIDEKQAYHYSLYEIYLRK